MKNKKTSTARRHCITSLRLKPLVLTMATLIPSSAFADMIVDTAREKGLNVSNSANGTPLININDPNNKGISHNRFSEFDVDKQGVIFNNSMQDGVSQTGGYVIKNNHLANEAKAIITEVTGSKGTHLDGSMEVFGRAADLVIVNENGITVNGVSTLNANNLTLSTGKVNYDAEGNLQLAVERGNVSIEGAGINTEGLSYFDIISRSATLSGEIAGSADVKVVTGLNDYDTSTRSHSVRSKKGKDTPQVAIGGTHLGSMYGNRIQLISTESGAGVNHAGSIVGNNGIEISADGTISLAAVVSKSGSVHVAGNSITLNNNKEAGLGGLSAQQDVILTALSDLTINADVIAEGGIIRINADTLLQSAAKLLTRNNVQNSGAVPAIQINVADRYVLAGTLYAVDSNGDKIPGAEVVLSKGKYVVKVGSTIVDAAIMSDAAVTSVAGDMVINAGKFENQQGVIAIDKGSLVVNLNDTSINDGIVQASGSIELAGKTFKNKGVFTTRSNLKLTLGTLENSGLIYAEGPLVAKGETLTNTGELSTASHLDLEADSLENEGVIYANGPLVAKGKTLTNTGELVTYSDLNLEADALKNEGLIHADGSLVAKGETLTNTGELSTDRDLNLGMNSLENEGLIQATGAMEVKAESLKNTGMLNTSDKLNLAADTLENEGVVQSGGTLEANATKLINKGGFSSDSNIKLTLDSLENDDTIQANGKIEVKSETLNNTGSINSNSDLEMTLGSLKNEGDLYGENIALSAGKATNSGNIIAEEGDLTLTITGEESVTNSGVLQGKNTHITTAGKLINEGDILAENQLNIKAEKLDNSKYIISEADINLTAKSELLNKGEEAIISANNTLSVTSMSDKTLAMTNSDGAVMQSTDGDINLKGLTSLVNSEAEIIAQNNLQITDVNKLTNRDGLLQGGQVTLADIASLESSGEGSTILADTALSISRVDNLTNSEGTIYSYDTLSIDKVKNLFNTAAYIAAEGNVKFSSVDLLTNEEGGAIFSDYHSVFLDTVKNLKNLSGSIVTAAENVDIVNALSVINDEESEISAMGDLSFKDVKALNNAGAILSNASLILDNMTTLLNKGEYAWIQGLDIIFKKIGSIVNEDYAAIMADDNLDISEVNTLLNQAGAFIQAYNMSASADTITNTGYESQIIGIKSVSLVADNVNNADQAGIYSEGSLSIKTDTLNNELESVLWANSYTLNADTLKNRGEILSDAVRGNSTIDVTSLDNVEGVISNSGYLTTTAKNFNNVDGYIMGGNSLTLNLQRDYKNSEGTVMSPGQLNINTTGDVTIDEAMESRGTVNIKAKNIYNDHSIVSLKDVYLTATNIVNGIVSLIYSINNTVITASETFLNKLNGNVMSQQQIVIKADKIHNQAGVIRSEGNMWLDAARIHNESTYKDATWDLSAVENGQGEYSEGGPTWEKWHVIYVDLPGLGSDIALEHRAEISSGANIRINKLSDGSAGGSSDISNDFGEETTTEIPDVITVTPVINNEGGIIQAAGDIDVRGDLYNAPKYISLSVEEYLKTELSNPMAIETSGYDVGSSYKHVSYFYTAYDLFDYLFAGKDNSGSLDSYFMDSGTRGKLLSAMQNLGGSHSSLNALMNKIFGEQWKASDLNKLSSRWAEVAKTTSTQNSGNTLQDIKYYFLPSEKAAMVAGRNFTHTGGSFNNGIASELAENVQENKVVTVEVDGKEVNTIEQSYEVKFNKKNSAEISMNISTLPAMNSLVQVKGLFEKSSAFIDYIASQNSAGSGAAGSSATVSSGVMVSSAATVSAGTAGTNRIIPMYETRPEMIDQSRYYGSDYFFETVGYNSEEPIIVVGDNYFFSELIRRQIQESTGTFLDVKYNAQAEDLVKVLFDNTGMVVNSEQGSTFAVGQALTQEQIASLDKDIIWLVSQQIDGVDVLVPTIYLASSTIEEMNEADQNGAAIVHAGNNVVVDAENIQNANAVISSGNNMQLKAKRDINNISSGMDAGISAGGSMYVVSTEGNITNSGSSIKAGENLSLVAEGGDINIIASAGRDDEGNQQIGSYDDGISAGGNMYIKAKEVDITGVAINGGDSEDNFVAIISTEGNVNFNDVHEIKSSYEQEGESAGLLSYSSKETVEVTATSKTSSVNTNGTFVVDAAEDVVFTGGEYNASSASINAGGNVTVKTSQDHSFKKVVEEETGLVFGAKADLPGMEAQEFNASTLHGSSTSDAEYQAQGPDGNMSNSNTKRPGAAALADTGAFKAGMQTTTVTTTESSTTNENASFNFKNGADISAGKTLDIGGMDLTVGDDATANLSGEDIISTKYEDVHKTSVETSETFVGVKGEGHSAVVDMVNKNANRVEKSTDGMEVDPLLTAVEAGGDVSNILLNDTAGGSVSVGWSQTKNQESSETRSENINHISGGKINFNAKNDINLKGVDIEAGEVNVDAGGDFTLSAAESSTYETSSTSEQNASLALSGGAGLTGAGVGASVDYTGSSSSREKSSTTYTNSSINAKKVTVKTKGDMTMEGANIEADDADIDVGGDLSITSKQNTSTETASSAEWGASVGVAITNKGVLPTVSANGGGGSEEHVSNITEKQSGIKTNNSVNVKTGGDLNLTGGHIVSENGTGSVDVGGDINSNELVDNVDSSGTYGGGGAGISYKGTPTGNFYVNTLDETHKKETQNNTINVGITNGNVNGDINTDKDNLSTVTQDDKKAGNNISYTVVPPKTNKKPDSNTSAPDSSSQRPGSSDAPNSSTPGTVDNTDRSTQRPGGSDAPNSSTPGTVDNTDRSTQRPGGSDAPNSSTPGTVDNTDRSTQKPGSSDTPKASTPEVEDNTGHAVQKPGRAAPEASTPKGTDTVDAGKKGTKWPTVQPVKPYVGGTGSASRPGSGNYAGSAKPAGNSPAQNGQYGQHAGGVRGPANGAPAQKGNQQAGEAGASTGPVKRWPTVQPVKPFVGGTGSASRPESGNYAGSAKPAGNSPAQNGQYAGGARSPANGATAQKGNQQAGGAGASTGPVKAWPTVQPVKPIIGGTGSASRPGSGNYAGSAKPSGNSPAQNNQFSKASDSSQSQNKNQEGGDNESE